MHIAMLVLGAAYLLEVYAKLAPALPLVGFVFLAEIIRGRRRLPARRPGPPA